MENACNIPSDEIRQDIRDTELEIETMRREERGYRLIGDRMSIFRADARSNGIKERLEFIAKLRNILFERGEL